MRLHADTSIGLLENKPTLDDRAQLASRASSD
jgi:hypothetical protein